MKILPDTYIYNFLDASKNLKLEVCKYSIYHFLITAQDKI